MISTLMEPPEKSTNNCFFVNSYTVVLEKLPMCLVVYCGLL
uniref:Uncharacterized protein n=1 Tax=Arundo donax TaxID=35708 RepID=A0A0A9C441_ARUDO